eukprot:tig00020960_g16548.t1
MAGPVAGPSGTAEDDLSIGDVLRVKGSRAQKAQKDPTAPLASLASISARLSPRMPYRRHVWALRFSELARDAVAEELAISVENVLRIRRSQQLAGNNSRYDPSASAEMGGGMARYITEPILEEPEPSASVGTLPPPRPQTSGGLSQNDDVLIEGDRESLPRASVAESLRPTTAEKGPTRVSASASGARPRSRPGSGGFRVSQGPFADRKGRVYVVRRSYGDAGAGVTESMELRQERHPFVEFLFDPNRDNARVKPYYEDGDPRWDSPENLAKRQKLRTNPGVVDAIRRFTRLFDTDNDGNVNKEAFLKVMTCVTRILIPKMTAEDAVAIASADWAKDSKGKAAMEFADLFQSVFEMADIWTRTVEPEEYLTTLDALNRRVRATLREQQLAQDQQR